MPTISPVQYHRGLRCASNSQVFSLIQNLFEGALPSWLGKLTNLVKLNLGENHFDGGSIPDALSNITMLASLELSTCNLTGTIPADIGKLGKLSDLLIARNQLRGPIPASLGNLSALSRLDLSTNLLDGSVPATVGSMNSLTYFVIFENSLQGDLKFLSALSNCRKLSVLEIDSNYFTGNLPDYVGNLSSTLQAFIARRNNISGVLPSTVWNLTSLKYLDLSDNQLHSTIS